MITLLRRDEGEAQTGIAGGRLNQPAAGLQTAVPLGGLDHGPADPILDRTARIFALELEEKAAGAGVQLGNL